MNIQITKRISFNELEGLLRNVPLMRKDFNIPEIKVYKNSHITLKKFKAHEVNPPTFYLLNKNLQFQRDLRYHFLSKYNIDTLNLDEALEIINEKSETWLLTPPIIELTPRIIKYIPQKDEIMHDEEIKVYIPLICDGAHRVELAKELDIEFTSVFISGVDENFPYYAHPNSWNKVKIVNEVPHLSKKKLYRLQDSYPLYRDFSIIGCGGPRR